MSLFRDLHQPGNPFILANAWDVGSAKMLVSLGAQSIATSSAAHGFTLGLPDGTVTRDQALAHAETLVGSVDVPVSGDFENGWGDAPDTVAETVRLAAEVGLAGICIEDTQLRANTAYDRALAIERITAGASAARALAQDFFFVARADGVMIGVYDIDEAIARVQAYAKVGADGVYVPMPGDLAALGRVVNAVNVPVNALAAGPFSATRQAEFAALGVARISLGGALARVTHQALYQAGQAMFTNGDFSALGQAFPGKDMDRILGG